MSRHLVWVYGTLKSGQPNHEVLTNAENGICEFVGSAITANKWPLVIASKYNIPFLLHKCHSGKQISGEIYSVDDQMLLFLDQFECHPSYYTRLETSVTLEDGSQCLPWVYFLMNFKPEMLELPNIDNYSSYGSHGLRYVERSERDSNEGSDENNDVILKLKLFL